VWEEKSRRQTKRTRGRGGWRGGVLPPLTSLSSSAALCVVPYCAGDSSEEERDEGEERNRREGETK